MKTSALCSLLFCATLLFGQAFAGEAEDARLKAAAEGDAPRIVLDLSDADPNIRDKEGSTPLIHGSGLGDQTISAQGLYPSDWIGENW